MQSICCYLLTTSHNVISSFADVEQRGKAVWAPVIKPYQEFIIRLSGLVSLHYSNSEFNQHNH